MSWPDAFAIVGMFLAMAALFNGWPRLIHIENHRHHHDHYKDRKD